MNQTLQQDQRQITPALFFAISIARSDGIKFGTNPLTTIRYQLPPTMPSLRALQQQSVRINRISRFLDKVELHFAQTPNVYSRFLDLLDAFKNQEIDAPRAIERVSDLFAAHEGLLLEFHALSQYQSGHSEADDQSQESTSLPYQEQAVPNEALQFLNRLATRYTHDISIFQRFLDTMQDFTDGIFLPPEHETVYAAKYDPASERDFKGEWWAI
ncbi:MAG: hypothetical protein Q9198_002657 [Flavoplaca austrocitrina]